MRIVPLTITVLSSFLSACSYNDPWFIHNQPGDDFEVIVGDSARVIPDGQSVRMKGLHHTGFRIVLRDQEHSYYASARELMAEWGEHRGRYICDGILGARFDVVYDDKYRLWLQPCEEGNEPLLIREDNERVA